MGISNIAALAANWDPQKHPRATGGQFAPLGYNAQTNTGAGYGSKNGDSRVKTAQTALNRAGMTDAQGNKLKLDGKLGPRTTAAIKRYQRAHGLKPDGKITPALLAQLKKGGGKKPAKAGTTHRKAALKAKPRRMPTPVSRDPAMG